MKALEDTQSSLLSELELTTSKLADVGQSATANEETNVDTLRRVCMLHDGTA